MEGWGSGVSLGRYAGKRGEGEGWGTCVRHNTVDVDGYAGEEYEEESLEHVCDR